MWQAGVEYNSARSGLPLNRYRKSDKDKKRKLVSYLGRAAFGTRSINASLSGLEKEYSWLNQSHLWIDERMTYDFDKTSKWIIKYRRFYDEIIIYWSVGLAKNRIVFVPGSIQRDIMRYYHAPNFTFYWGRKEQDGIRYVRLLRCCQAGTRSKQISENDTGNFRYGERWRQLQLLTENSNHPDRDDFTSHSL